MLQSLIYYSLTRYLKQCLTHQFKVHDHIKDSKTGFQYFFEKFNANLLSIPNRGERFLHISHVL